MLEYSQEASTLKLNNVQMSDAGGYILELAGPERAKNMTELKVYQGTTVWNYCILCNLNVFRNTSTDNHRTKTDQKGNEARGRMKRTQNERGGVC